MINSKSNLSKKTVNQTTNWRDIENQNHSKGNINYGTLMPSTSVTEVSAVSRQNDLELYDNDSNRIDKHSAVITLSDETLHIYGYKRSVLKAVINFYNIIKSGKIR